MRKKMRQRQLFRASQLDSMPSANLLSQFNPEETATSNLLMISNEDFDLETPEYPLIPEQVNPKIKERNIKTSSTRKNSVISKKRVSVVEHYTECFQMAHKAMSQELHSEHEHHFQKNTVNPCNFLLFTSQNYNNIKVVEGVHQPCIGSPDNFNQKLKQSKTFSNFMRRRNKSLMKQYLDISQEQQHQNYAVTKRIGPPPALSHITKSCELRKKDIDDTPSPIKIISPVKIDKEHLIELKCTNPSFRNKRGNYKQFRYASNVGVKSQRKSTQK